MIVFHRSHSASCTCRGRRQLQSPLLNSTFSLPCFFHPARSLMELIKRLGTPYGALARLLACLAQASHYDDGTAPARRSLCASDPPGWESPWGPGQLPPGRVGLEPRRRLRLRCTVPAAPARRLAAARAFPYAIPCDSGHMLVERKRCCCTSPPSPQASCRRGWEAPAKRSARAAARSRRAAGPQVEIAGRATQAYPRRALASSSAGLTRGAQWWPLPSLVALS
jgi:hypothetical protein